MWYGLVASSSADRDYADSVTQLLRSTARNLVLSIGGMCLIWQFIAVISLPDELSMKTALLVLIVSLTGVLTIRLLDERLLLAQAIWQMGLVLVVVLAIYLFQQPVISFFYTLLPLMAVVTIGWPAGLLVEGLIGVAVWWLSLGTWTPALPVSYGLAIVGGGAIAGTLGWGVTRTLLTVTQWSLFSMERVRAEMETARDRQVELKQVQEDLLQANQELARLSDRLKAMRHVAEEARRAKEEFVANVSHELRTPLNMIIGFSEMIAQSPGIYGARLPAALLADITAIQRNSQHLAKLVDDVLDLSQIEAGRMALSKEWVSLPAIVDGAVQAVRALFESKGLSLQVEISHGLPPVYCDGTRIRQVVINLLSNAGRFTERGKVRVRVWPENDVVVVSVNDTGPGIAPEDQERLFIPFQQVDSSIRRQHDGSGLGLSISKRFVEMHGGKMWIESELGEGTTIIFRLPLDTPPPAISPSGDVVRRVIPSWEYRVRTRRSRAPIPTVVPRFVVLEEGQTLHRMLSRYADDIEVVSVQNVEEAVRELSRSPARACVVNTPSSEEVLALTDQLTNSSYDTPVVSCWVPGVDEAARRLGVTDYLVKPITRERLLFTLSSLGENVETVLVVDDEPEVLQLFTRMLSTAQRGYRILQAKSGHLALDLLRERRPDVVLLDLTMPGMDGFQVLREKSQDPAIREIPVIVVSSRDPIGEPVVSHTLTVMHGGGLSVPVLMDCIQAVSEIVAPSGQFGDRGQPERYGA
jgi:signal transduction histidine kinase/CheY-like chemotaxis protein